MNLEIAILRWVARLLGISKEYETLKKKLGNIPPRITPHSLPKPPPSND